MSSRVKRNRTAWTSVELIATALLVVLFGSLSATASAADGADLRAKINQARSLIDAGDLPKGLGQLAEITAALDGRGAQPLARMSVADLYRTAVNELDAKPTYRLVAYEQLLKAANEIAADDFLQTSWLRGYQGALYEDEERYDEALRLTRLAIGAAHKVPESGTLYRWEWQLARILLALGRNEAAVSAYERATQSLQRQRAALLKIDGSYQRVVRPLYYQFADLLLGQLSSATDEAQRRVVLEQTQNALEAVKAAEVEDYFQERCAVESNAGLNNVQPGTAVLYPVVLDDRLELILRTRGEIAHASVPVGRSELNASVRELRLNLQVDTATKDYLRLAQQLYGWLMTPLEDQFDRHQIDTLVVIPDGALRTIPLAALHDGDRYVVERFAMATAPGLNLVASASLDTPRASALASGLSESVQGFSALPSVTQELSAVQNAVSTRVLENSAFTKSAVTRELTRGGYSIVHLATHGQFRGSYADSFLLTHDGRLQINELGDALRERQALFGPLDLLVLSACETAAGDDRAALGVAGVAIKSGARSAIASLWEVDDAATKDLIAAFYTNLARDPAVSKANHLRAAQRQLLADQSLQHPSNWAPFLIIGDWL